MVAIAIIAVLAAVGFTSYSQAQKLARDSKRKQDLKAIAAALELFYADNRRYPLTSASDGTLFWAASTVDGSNWIFDRTSTGTGTNAFSPTYMDRLPKDPLSNGNAYSASSTGYYYFSYYTGDYSTPACKAGQYYFLATRLENTNDPDNVAHNNFAVCGGTSTNAIALSNGATYLIVRQ
jgi:type II secretory pathway pseudopilin PulG